MKKILLLLVLVVAAATVYAVSRHLEAEGRDSEWRLYGNVDIREVQLGFRVPGRLQQMLFEEGDRVDAGVVVANLDAVPQQEALRYADARVHEARAVLERALRGSRPQEIEQAQAAVEEARAAAVNSEKVLLRQRDLTERKLSSQQLLDTAEASYEQAAARLDSAREGLELALAGTRAEDIEAAEAGLAAAIAQQDQSKTQLADTQLYAPSGGIIQTRVVEPGSILGVGSPVYSLSLDDKVYLRTYVNEARLGSVVPGTRVQVSTDSSNRIYEGVVGFVSPRAEFTPKSVETTALRTDLVYRLRIVISNPDSGLRQGMPVTIELRRSGD